LKTFLVTITVARDKETDLSRTLENEVLTFSSRANWECEGTGEHLAEIRTFFASDLAWSAAFPQLFTMPSFLWYVLPQPGKQLSTF
jgi:hypothetical protein